MRCSSGMMKAAKLLAYVGVAVGILIFVYYFYVSRTGSVVLVYDNQLPSDLRDQTDSNSHQSPDTGSTDTAKPSSSQGGGGEQSKGAPAAGEKSPSQKPSPKSHGTGGEDREEGNSPGNGDPADQTPSSDTEEENGGSFTELFDEQMRGRVNFDYWHWIVGYLVDDMRIKKTFPNEPDERKSKVALKSFFSEVDPNDVGGKYAHKVYGYLIPPDTGDYVFSIEYLKLTAATETEFWLSTDSDPMNLEKVVSLLFPLDTPNRKKNQTPNKWQESGPRMLKANTAYYFEFLQKAFDGMVTTEIRWQLPGKDIHITIPSENIAMAVKLDGDLFTDWPIVSKLKGELPSNKLQSHHLVDYIGDKVVPISDLDILPQCEFHCLYASVHEVPQYQGVKQVFESSVYPVDDTWSMNRQKQDRGNKKIPAETANQVVDLYKKAFSANQKYSSEVELRYLEETDNKKHGKRFLLELDINLNGREDVVHTSEYVYLPSGQDQKLCHTSNFQWTKNVDVHIVVSLKNLGLWVKHLIQNVERIYEVTKDDNFQLIIVDYDSEDIDVKAELQKSTFKRWKLVQNHGPFTRSGGLQSGVEAVKNPDSIVMTIDMHLTLPPGFVEYVRRHVVKGKMAFAPMFFRLHPGYTDVNINGWWETLTYGLFGLYRSDWDTFGGFSTDKYKYKWGGEDWDLLDKSLSKGFETFRIRYPGLMHYHHTKVGMWEDNHR